MALMPLFLFIWRVGIYYRKVPWLPFYVEMCYMIHRVFVDSDNEDDESKFIDDEDDDESGPSYPHVADNDDEEEDELDKFMAGIEVF